MNAPVNIKPIHSQQAKVKTSADAKRAKLEKNRKASEGYTANDLRDFDKLTTKRDNPRTTPQERSKAIDALAEIEARQGRRRDTAWADGAIGETISLAEEQGAVVTRRADGGAKRELGPGLGWLWTKGKITQAQVAAGKRYGDDFAEAGPSLKSCLNDSGGGRSENAGLPSALSASSFDLDKARSKGLHGMKHLIALCDDVCGQGYKLTELHDVREVKAGEMTVNSRKVEVLEERLKGALDLLVIHYKLV